MTLCDLSKYALGAEPPLFDNQIKGQNPQEVTFPDLHGNALGMLFRLEAHGILTLTKEQRKRLAAIYGSSTHLTLEDLSEFEDILKKVVVNKDKFQLVRFIGDILGDRGNNDILTLLVLNKLIDSQVNITVLFSNHDMELLSWYLAHQVKSPDEISGFNRAALLTSNLDTSGPNTVYRRSLDNLIKFVNQFSDQKPKVLKLIDKVYKPSVKLFDYLLDATTQPPTVMLFSHAPVGLEALQALALRYHVNYDISMPEKLFEMIDQINQAFSAELQQSPPVKFANELAKEFTHFRRNGMEDGATHIPLVYLAWNRDNQHFIDLPTQNFVIVNIHGHMGGFKRTGDPLWDKMKNISGVNLDANNHFGKSLHSTDNFGKPANEQDVQGFLSTQSTPSLQKEYKESKVATLPKKTFTFFQSDHLNKLLNAVITGNQIEAEKLIKAHPTLLLRSGIVTDHCGRSIEGTALQIALGAEDVDQGMTDMISRYLLSLPDGANEIIRQYNKQFSPEYQDIGNAKHEKSLVELATVFSALADAKPDQDTYESTEEACTEALSKFNFHLEQEAKNDITVGKHFDVALYIQALHLYKTHFAPFGGDKNSFKNLLAWQKIIGTIERFLPVCYIKALGKKQSSMDSQSIDNLITHLETLYDKKQECLQNFTLAKLQPTQQNSCGLM